MSLSFLLIALLTVGSAAIAMVRRNVIHSALLLIGSWLGVATFYLWAGAEFVAFAQVLVYVGAVSMVVLFAVLLTRRSRSDLPIPAESKGRAATAILVGGSVAAVLISAVVGTPLATNSEAIPALTVKGLGTALAADHGGALLIAGIILTVTLIGAVVIAATEKNSAPRKEGSS